MVWYGHDTALEEKKNFPSFLSLRFCPIGKELFLKIMQFVNFLFYFKNTTIPFQAFFFAQGPFSNIAWGHVTHHMTSQLKNFFLQKS